MPLHPAYAQVSALLFAVFILIAGNGLLSTFVPLSAVAAKFSDFTIGLIASSYFLGMLIGCIATPRLVARAGHIRAFAALSSVAAVSALAHAVFPEPSAWALIRGITGFCFAGLFATIESWFHDKADNAVRGKVLALYQMFNFAGSALGQQMVRLAPPGAFALFSAAAALLSLAVLPLAFTKSDPPEPPPVPRLRLWYLYGLSPVALIGVLTAGAANGTLWSLGPVFAASSGLSTGGVATFMTVIILAAALVQWPTGRLADRYDRRIVMLLSLFVAMAVEVAFIWFVGSGELVLVLLAMALGATALTVYPLSSGHAADLSNRENMVEISTGLLLTYTVGAIIGPTVCAAMMTWLGPKALFIHNLAIHVAFVCFIMWRLWARPPRTDADKARPTETEPFVRPIRK
jgi:MFS family permease